MPAGAVFICTSLDGFIAREDGALDWLPQPEGEEDHGFADFMASVDGIVMGRGTYEAVRGFGDWPYEKPAVVLSQKLAGTEVPGDIAGRVRFWSSGPEETMQRLAAEGWTRVYVDGGQVIAAFLRAKLIAEITVFRAPVLIGHGTPLFGALEGDVKLRLLSSRDYPGGLVEARYAVEG